MRLIVGQIVKFINGGKIGINQADAFFASDFLKQLRNAIIGQRAGGKVDIRRAFGNLFIFGLNHAAGQPDDHVASFFGQSFLFDIIKPSQI